MKFKNIMLKIFSIIFSSAIISNGSSFCPHISAISEARKCVKQIFTDMVEWYGFNLHETTGPHGSEGTDLTVSEKFFEDVEYTYAHRMVNGRQIVSRLVSDLLEKGIEARLALVYVEGRGWFFAARYYDPDHGKYYFSDLCGFMNNGVDFNIANMPESVCRQQWENRIYVMEQDPRYDETKWRDVLQNAQRRVGR